MNNETTIYVDVPEYTHDNSLSAGAAIYYNAAVNALNAKGVLVREILAGLIGNRDGFREEFAEACQKAYSLDDKGKLLSSLRASLNNAYKIAGENGKLALATIPQYGVQVDKGIVTIGIAKPRNTTSNWIATKATEKLAAIIAETGVDKNAVAMAKFLAMAGFTASDMEAIADIMENEGEDGDDE